jgi:hypothetical protein
VFESVATEDASAVAVTVGRRAVDHEADAVPAPVADQLPSDSAFVAASERCDLDEFEFAARLFSFTGRPRCSVPRPPLPSRRNRFPLPRPSSMSPHAAARVARRSPARRCGVVLGGRHGGRRPARRGHDHAGGCDRLGIRLVDTASPPSSPPVEADEELDAGQIQAFVASGTDAPTALDRPKATTSRRCRSSAESGVRLFANTWVNDPSSPIQYPFPVGADLGRLRVHRVPLGVRSPTTAST